MQPVQGQLYYAGNPGVYPHGMQVAQSGLVPTQAFLVPVPGSQPGVPPPPPGAAMYGTQAPPVGLVQYAQQPVAVMSHGYAPVRPSPAAPPAGRPMAAAPPPSSSGPRIMRAQQLGAGGSLQMQASMPQSAYGAQPFVQQGMVLVQQPGPPPPQFQLQARAQVHHYAPPPPRPGPPQQQQQQQQQQHQQQQQQSRQSGHIMRPQQLGSPSPKIMRPTVLPSHPPPAMQQQQPGILHMQPGAQGLQIAMSPRPSAPAQPYPGPPAAQQAQRPMLAASLPGQQALIVPPPSAPHPGSSTLPQQRPYHQQQQHAPLIVHGGRGPQQRQGPLGGAGGGPRGVLLQAPGKRQPKKKDIVLPVEKLTQDPVPRPPVNETERKEVDEWIKERKKHFPTTDNVAKKAQEARDKAARGELDLLREERRRRLHDVLARQQRMGLAKAAGTEDLYFSVARGGGGRRGGRGGGRGAGRGRDGGGRGARPFGYEAFLQAGEAPQQQQWQPQASGANSQPVQQQQQQAGERSEAAAMQAEAAGQHVAGSQLGAGPQLGSKRPLKEGNQPGDVHSEAKRQRGESIPQPLSPEGQAVHPVSNGTGDGEVGVAEEPADVTLQTGAQPQQQQQPYQHQQQQWVPRGGRGGRGRGRGGREGFAEGRGWGRGRGRERGRGRGRVSWQEQRPGDPQQQRQHGQHAGPAHPQQQQPWRPPRPSSPTLLQKLLAKEIRQDHSYLLQAFRFFVANNFLLDYAAGKELEFPQHQDQGVQQAQQVQPASLEEVLAKEAELAQELELSGDEMEATAVAPAITAPAAASVILTMPVTAATPVQHGGAPPTAGPPYERLAEDAADASSSEVESEEDCSSGEDESEGEEQGQLLQPELDAGAGYPAVEPMALTSYKEGRLGAAGKEGELLAKGLLLGSGGLAVAGGEGDDDVEFS
ncbi:hypothetical protein N2152v2_006344 [Parachlorella kessleri]